MTDNKNLSSKSYSVYLRRIVLPHGFSLKLNQLQVWLYTHIWSIRNVIKSSILAPEWRILTLYVNLCRSWMHWEWENKYKHTKIYCLFIRMTITNTLCMKAKIRARICYFLSWYILKHKIIRLLRILRFGSQFTHFHTFHIKQSTVTAMVWCGLIVFPNGPLWLKDWSPDGATRRW
jgi:hypothetical protein